jgi:hypothetical protein
VGPNALFEAGGSRGDPAAPAHSADFGNIQWTQPEAICKFGVDTEKIDASLTADLEHGVGYVGCQATAHINDALAFKRPQYFTLGAIAKEDLSIVRKGTAGTDHRQGKIFIKVGIYLHAMKSES